MIEDVRPNDANIAESRAHVSRSGPVAPSVTIDQMARDGVEVAELVRTRVHQPRIVLLGQSWGSMLGVRMARARPDLFYAYVGTGQVVNQGKSQTAAYSQLLQEARAKGDRDAIAALSALGPPPYDSESKWAVYTKWVTAYERRASYLKPIVASSSEGAQIWKAAFPED